MVATFAWISFILVAGSSGLDPCTVRLPTDELIDYDATDFLALDTLIHEATFLNFGESSHGLVGMHQAATRMFRYLVEMKDFRVLIFESAWGIDEAMQTFFHSNRTTFNTEEQFFLNAFSSRYTHQLLLWIREFNRLNPDDPIQVGGYQPEQPVTDLKALWETMSKSSQFNATHFQYQFNTCKAKSTQFSTDLDFVIHMNQLRKQGRPSFTADELRACNMALDEMKLFLNDNRKELINLTSLNGYREADAHLLSFHSYLNILLVHVDAVFLNRNMTAVEAFQLGHTIYQEGDRIRFELFNTLYETRYKGRRTMFWMHNWHAMKNSPQVWYSDNIPKGTVSMGTRLAQKYSNREYLVLGSIVACPQCKNQLRNDSIEGAFVATLGTQSSIIDLKNNSNHPSNLPVHTPGSLLVQSDETHLMDVILSKQFDAVYYLYRSKLLAEDFS